MYRCDKCGHVFEEPKQYIEDTGEQSSGCPLCYGDYTDIYECEWCGKYTEDERCICEKCISDTLKKFSNLIKANFCTEEREILEENIDSLSFCD